MKILLTLVAASLLVGCANQRDLPAFPADKVDKQYAILEGSDGIFRCVEYDVVSVDPYQIKRVAIYTNLKACDQVGGFKPEAFVALKNWAEDVRAWAKDRECTIKVK